MSVNLIDSFGNTYWSEVGIDKFTNNFRKMFAARTSEECGGHWNSIRNAPFPPEIHVGESFVIIHQETAIYSDFRIDFSEGYPRFYLHNYGFSV